MMFKTQPDKIVDYVMPFFASKNDASFVVGNIVSQYQMLPCLRGFWPMSSVDENASTYDLSGQGRTLSANGGLFYSQSSSARNINYAFVNDVPRYLSRTDEAGFDITGTETYIAEKGLTIGLWTAFSGAIPPGAVNRTLIGKWDSSGGQCSYAIQVDENELPMFSVSDNGSNVYSILSPERLHSSAGRWQFVVGRYDTLGTDEMSIYVSTEITNDGRVSSLVKTNLDVGVPPSIHVGTAEFTIGAETSGVNPVVSARVSLAFLCACALTDEQIEVLYRRTRALFKEGLT